MFGPLSRDRKRSSLFSTWIRSSSCPAKCRSNRRNRGQRKTPPERCSEGRDGRPAFWPELIHCSLASRVTARFRRRKPDTPTLSGDDENSCVHPSGWLAKDVAKPHASRMRQGIRAKCMMVKQAPGLRVTTPLTVALKPRRTFCRRSVENFNVARDFAVFHGHEVNDVGTHDFGGCGALKCNKQVHGEVAVTGGVELLQIK